MHLTEALIIRKREIGENDKQLELLTPELGRIGVIARGTRKIISKLNPHLAFLNLLSVGFVWGPKNKVLVSVDTLKIFRGNDYKRYQAGFTIIKLIDKLVWSELPEPVTFNLIREALSKVENLRFNSQSVVLQFKVELIKILGYWPELNRCVNCQAASFTRKMFSYQKGGLLCSNCLATNDIVEIGDDSFWLKISNLFNESTWNSFGLSKEEFKRAELFTDKLISYFSPSLNY